MPNPTYERTGLPEEVRTPLIVAFQQDGQRHAEQYLALGCTKSVELKDYLAEQIVRTLKEWMHARDSSAAATSGAQAKLGALSADPAGSVPNLPLLTMISSWLNHWWFVWVLNEPSYVQALRRGVLALDGAEEYRSVAGLR